MTEAGLPWLNIRHWPQSSHSFQLGVCVCAWEMFSVPQELPINEARKFSLSPSLPPQFSVSLFFYWRSLKGQQYANIFSKLHFFYKDGQKTGGAKSHDATSWFTFFFFFSSKFDRMLRGVKKFTITLWPIIKIDFWFILWFHNCGSSSYLIWKQTLLIQLS